MPDGLTRTDLAETYFFLAQTDATATHPTRFYLGGIVDVRQSAVRAAGMAGRPMSQAAQAKLNGFQAAAQIVSCELFSMQISVKICSCIAAQCLAGFFVF